MIAIALSLVIGLLAALASRIGSRRCANDIAQLLAPTSLAGALVFPVSAIEGTGVAVWRRISSAALAALPQRPGRRIFPAQHRSQFYRRRRGHGGDRHGRGRGGSRSATG
ncbi:MAG: hypothetical protein WDO24_00260 [Pseudomonadota bacterium]